MIKIKDPFWNIVGSFDIDEVFVLPEWIQQKTELNKKINPKMVIEKKLSLQQELDRCTRCSLHKSSYKPFVGQGNTYSGILVVAEQPALVNLEIAVFSKQEKELFEKIMKAIDLNNEDYFITNIVKCPLPSNRKPTMAESEICAVHLQKQIDAIKPGIILVLGAIAARTLLDTRVGIGLLREKLHHYQDIPLVVTYPPKALINSPALKRPAWEDMKRLKILLSEAHLPRSKKNG